MAELRSSKPTTGVRFSLLLLLRKIWFTPKYRRQTPKTISYLKQFWIKKWINSNLPFKGDLPLARSCWSVNRRSVKIIHNTFFSLKHSHNLSISRQKKLIGAAVFRTGLESFMNSNHFLNIFVVKSTSYSSLGSFMGWTGSVFLKNRKLMTRRPSDGFKYSPSISNFAHQINPLLNTSISIVKMRSKCLNFRSQYQRFKTLNAYNLMNFLHIYTTLNRIQKLRIDSKLNEGHIKRAWSAFNQLAYSHVKKNRPKKFIKRRLRNTFRFHRKKLHLSHGIYYSKTFSVRSNPQINSRSQRFTKSIASFWINTLLFKSRIYLEDVCEVDDYLPTPLESHRLDYSRKLNKSLYPLRNFDLKYNPLNSSFVILDIITWSISYTLSSTLAGSLYSNNISSRLSNNMGLSLSTSSTTAQSLLKIIFAGELEDYILKNYAGQFFFKPSFEPINERYASTYLTSLINKFFTYQVASSVLTSITFDFYKKLTFSEQVRLRDFTSRLILFSSQFSTIFFLSEFIDVIYFSLKLCNLTIIFDYVQRVLKKLVIWDHKKFLFFLFNLYKEQMYPLFNYLGIRGLKILIKGKVGVGGNSRKRSIALVLGSTTSTALYSSAHSINRLLSTTTGALGFRVWLLYSKPIHSYAGKEV